ncbi:DNA polymerase I [Hymenobacter taeanensis]|uniref:DNA polymerase I n=1 Tax=Hymenobacter taeanensis TaxID=2735321 RepID=A0A6M6BGN7_9BACT|nr:MULTISPECIES: DNA polymerase I [Hymenobacter]QJX47028.1 DNA polymerase I [Hymenobacter taeanensis]UOQ80906.1 DNA polymerase I [Hymenobacter sp. 5414T-23]
MTTESAAARPHKLFLLDAFALIYRAHFAFSKNPRVNSKGLNTGAILGFTNTLVEVLQKEKPTHIGVAFDAQKKTFRHEQFADYKAQRQAMPEDIGLAIPYIKKIIKAFNIPILMVDGFEADDVIGTLAQRAEAQGFGEVFMMTPDKDYCQLVTDCIKIYRPAFMGNAAEVLDVQHVLQRFEVERVEQVIDILGLQGDASDNIPGIPGIGEKTAKKLVQEFGSVENLIANVDQLKGKLQENVRNFAEQGLMSKELATIHLTVPIEFHEENLRLEEPDAEQLRQLFDELEFRQLAARVLGGGSPAGVSSTAPPSRGARRPKVAEGQGSLFGGSSDAAVAIGAEEGITGSFGAPAGPRLTLADVPHNYHLIDTPELRKSLLKFLLQQKEVSFDTETTGLDTMTARLVGLSFCWLPGEAYYVPVPTDDQSAAQALVDEFCPFFEAKEILKIGQNIKYDLTILKHYNVQVHGPLFDTMLAHYLLEPDMRHNMDVLAETYLHYTPVSIISLIGPKGKNQKTMADLPPAEVSDYACEDADVTLQLKHVFEPMLKEVGLLDLLNDVENPLVPVLADIEYEGVKIDSNAMGEYSAELQGYIQEIEQQIFSAAGEEFNIGSPKQLGEVLFDRLGLGGGKIKKTKTGQYATGEEVLSTLAADNPIAGLILEHRQLTKLRSTYVEALPQLVCELDGRVHTSFNQAVTATGRLSSTNPNLQNIPIRTEKGREIRKAFVPRDDQHVLLAADYSQVELRIMADFSGDKTMIEAFRQGLDIHTSTASKVFHVPLDQVDGEMRRKAKTVNFGIIYGISAFGLAQRIGISRKEATEIIDTYFQEFASVKQFMDESINKARELEYATTLLGRRRYLRDINSRNATLRGYTERNAINAPIQGTAADIIKKAMINIHEWLIEEKLGTRMILQVHDELVFDAVREEVEYITPKIKELMTQALLLPRGVPLEVEVGTGNNWLQAH